MADAVAARPVTASTVFLPNLDSIIRGMLYLYIFSLSSKYLLFVERNGFIILIVLLALWCAANRRHFFLRTPIDLPLIVFVAWVGFTVSFATFPAYSFKEFAKLLQQGLIFYAVVYFFREPLHRWRLVWMLIGTVALVAIYGLWEFFHIEPGYYIESFLHGDDALATYLVMLIPFSAGLVLYLPRGPLRFLAGVTTALGLLCLFLTFSRAGVLAVMTEAAVFVWLARQRRVTYVAGAVVLTLLIAATGFFMAHRTATGLSRFTPGPGKFTAYNFEARLNIWRFAFDKLKEHPVVGIGFGRNNFYMATKTESESLASTATTVMPAGTHSTFLDMAVGSGVPALLAWLWLLWAMIKASLQQFHAGDETLVTMVSLALISMVFGMCVRNFFNHMWVGTLAVQFWVLVGLTIMPLCSRKPLEPSAA